MRNMRGYFVRDNVLTPIAEAYHPKGCAIIFQIIIFPSREFIALKGVPI
jgi:hypothetical protein